MSPQELLNIIAQALEYPSEELREKLFLIIKSGNYDHYDKLNRFMDILLNTDIYNIQEIYVMTFDLSAETNMYLSYHIYGDRRDRGHFLAQLIDIYRKYGFKYDNRELPDYIPTVLRFLALRYNEHSPDINKLMGMTLKVIRKLKNKLSKDNPYTYLFDLLSDVLSQIQNNNYDL